MSLQIACETHPLELASEVWFSKIPDATSCLDRIRIDRQIHPFSVDDQRPRRFGARGAREDGGDDRHLQGAGRASRSPHRHVQPEEAGAGHGRIHGPGGAGQHRRRQGTGRRRRIQECRCARPCHPYLRRRGRPAPAGDDRSVARRTGDGRRADPGRPGRGRTSTRTDRKGSEAEPLRRARARTRRGGPLSGGARRRPSAPGAGLERRRLEAAARLSVPLRQAAPGGRQRR